MDEKQKDQLTSEEPQEGKQLTEGEMEEVVGGEWMNIDPEPIPIQTSH